MNILFISYDSYKYDGRLRELIKVAQELGEVTFITRDEGEEPISGQHILYKGSGYSEIHFLLCRAGEENAGCRCHLY